MKTSKFVQLDPKVLMEYIYDDSFNLSENYIVTQNLNEGINSFAPVNISGSNNRYENQLVTIDPVTLKSGIRNSNTYNFLIDRNYTQNLPIRHDRIKLHFPIDYSFEEYAGCYIRVYVMDFNNSNLVNLTNYYFDKQDQDRFNKELELSSPPNTLNGKLWGKFIELYYPSPDTLSSQRTNNLPNPNSINDNLTGGTGLSTTSPIMIEFGFLTKKETIDDITTFLLSSPFQTSVPQTPDFKNLSVTIEPNSNGDWFDIYGAYEGTSAGFNTFITSARQTGKRYYVEYEVSTFEENIKGKTSVFKIDENFNEGIEFRPIIKYSSTLASIEVLMRVIDRVDNSIITRRSAYGLLPDEVSKYSRSLVRINVNGIKTPKIYNLRNGGSLTDAINGLNNRSGISSSLFGDDIRTIRVPFPILTNTNNIVAKTESSILNGEEWKGSGKLKIVVNPFDNIFKFVLAKSVDTQVEYFNLLNTGTIQLYFKNYNTEIPCELYRKTGEIDLENGTVIFKLDKTKVADVRKIYNTGVNMFFITSTNEETDETTVIYEGTFIMSDSIEYVEELAIDFQQDNVGVEVTRNSNQEFAIVTRRIVDGENQTGGVSSNVSQNNNQILNDVRLASEIVSNNNTSFAVLDNNSQVSILNDFININRNTDG